MRCLALSYFVVSKIYSVITCYGNSRRKFYPRLVLLCDTVEVWILFGWIGF